MRTKESRREDVDYEPVNEELSFRANAARGSVIAVFNEQSDTASVLIVSL